MSQKCLIAWNISPAFFPFHAIYLWPKLHWPTSSSACPAVRGAATASGLSFVSGKKTSRGPAAAALGLVVSACSLRAEVLFVVRVGGLRAISAFAQTRRDRLPGSGFLTWSSLPNVLAGLSVLWYENFHTGSGYSL